MSENDSQQGDGKCGAKGRGGKPCGLQAGHGTDHVGIGRCKHHGGCTPNHEKAAQKEMAIRAVATYGLPREIDPHSALLEELHRTAGHVAWLASLIAQMESDKDLKQYQYSEDGGVIERPAVWVQMYADERKHFAKIAKTCIDVGIEERRVQLAEQQGELIAQVIRGVIEDLGQSSNPEVPQIVRRHLSLVRAA